MDIICSDVTRIEIRVTEHTASEGLCEPWTSVRLTITDMSGTTSFTLYPGPNCVMPDVFRTGSSTIP